jgi:hypothetical protein
MIGKLINVVIGRPVGVIISIKCGAILRKGGAGREKAGGGSFPNLNEGRKQAEWETKKGR